MTESQSTELTKVDHFKLALEGDWSDDLIKVIGSHMDPDRFKVMAVMAVKRTPKILECNRTSVLMSLMESARLGLYPDGRQAAIVPYRGEATLLPMVQGIIELMLRSPDVQKVEARAVHEGDEFEFEYGLNSYCRHRPAQTSTADRMVTHAYAIIWRHNAEPTFEVVDRDTIEQARQTSAAPDSPAWKNWYGEQARKVAVKRLAKYVDLTPEAQKLINWDHAVYGDPQMEGPVDGGPSDDYRNQHVKAETQDRIENLKKTMSGNAYTREDAERDLAEAGESGEAGESQVPDDGNGNDRTKPRPWPAKMVRTRFAEIVQENKGARRNAKIGKMEIWQYARWQLGECFAGDEDGDAKVHSVSAYLTGKDTAKDWTGAESMAFVKWLEPTEDAAGDLKPSSHGRMEAQFILKARMTEQVQTELPMEGE